MNTRAFRILALAAGLAVSGTACAPSGDSDGGGGGGGQTMYVSIGTAPIGGAFAQVGGALAEVLNENVGDHNWEVQAQGTKGSQENIRRLAQKGMDFALSNAAITYFAVRGQSGWDREYAVRAVMTLAPNVAMFISKRGSGIERIADLKGHRVVVGPAGAGFRMFVEPILEAHGVGYDDFTVLHAGQSGAVDMLSDGAAAAAFLGGAVPTGSITQACSTNDIHFIPYEEEAKAGLVAEYLFFQPATVTRDKYSDLEGDYHGLNVGSMHLITRADMDEELVYNVTRILYENRQAVITKHPAGRAIEKNAAVDTGVPFHPGALRYYREIGLSAAAAVGTGEAPGAATPENATAPSNGEPQ